MNTQTVLDQIRAFVRVLEENRSRAAVEAEWRVLQTAVRALASESYARGLRDAARIESPPK